MSNDTANETDPIEKDLGYSNIKAFPEEYIIGPDGSTADIEQPPPFSFQAQIEFFERLEKELEGAWRAGYEFLTLPSRKPGTYIFGAMVVQSSFVPHNDPDRFDGPFDEHSVTYPLREMVAGTSGPARQH